MSNKIMAHKHFARGVLRATFLLAYVSGNHHSGRREIGTIMRGPFTDATRWTPSGSETQHTALTRGITGANTHPMTSGANSTGAKGEFCGFGDGFAGHAGKSLQVTHFIGTAITINHNLCTVTQPTSG